MGPTGAAFCCCPKGWFEIKLRSCAVGVTCRSQPGCPSSDLGLRGEGMLPQGLSKQANAKNLLMHHLGSPVTIKSAPHQKNLLLPPRFPRFCPVFAGILCLGLIFLVLQVPLDMRNIGPCAGVCLQFMPFRNVHTLCTLAGDFAWLGTQNGL